MSKRRAALSLAIALCLAAPLDAQETNEAPTPSADLLAMRSKAENDPALRSLLQRLEDAMRRRNSDPAWDRRSAAQDFVFRGALLRTGMRLVMNQVMNLDEPVRISTLELLEPAQQRAQAISEVLRADLDGDWQITRDELLEAAKYQRIEGAAQAFVTSDVDRNDVLSTEEIKIAVDEMIKDRFAREDMGPNLMPVFDFDSDGYLSKAEFDRGVTALVQRAAD